MRHLKPAILPVLLIAGMTLMPATDATAHERAYHDYARPYAVLHPDYRQARLPRWLRHNYDFVRWYRINFYRLRPHASWKRLYRRYQRDYFYHRHYKRHDNRRYDRKRMKKHKRHRRERWDDDY